MLLATQNHPQAAALGGLLGALRLVLLLKLLGHPIALAIILSIIAAVVCASVAGNRGRNKIGWAFLGFFFSIVALTVLLLLPSKAPPEPESGEEPKVS